MTQISERKEAQRVSTHHLFIMVLPALVSNFSKAASTLLGLKSEAVPKVPVERIVEVRNSLALENGRATKNESGELELFTPRDWTPDRVSTIEGLESKWHDTPSNATKQVRWADKQKEAKAVARFNNNRVALHSVLRSANATASNEQRLRENEAQHTQRKQENDRCTEKVREHVVLARVAARKRVEDSKLGLASLIIVDEAEALPIRW